VDPDPLTYRDRWRVRQYEIDAYGHVNNAVYLNWAEEMASRHAEVSGFGAEWASQHGGGWVIRHHDVTYHAPARFGDELELMVQVELIRGTRGQRRTTIHRASDHRLLAEIATEWAWVRLSDGRPAPVPEELVRVAAPATAATLARRADRRRSAAG
jgi:acyl-CoA thioester hydrolase